MVYQNLRDSVDSWLSQHHLLYRMHLPITTTQIALINSITNAMETSPLQYRFPTPCDNTLAPHESLSLQQLGLSARGAPRANGQIYLRPRPVKSGTVLAELIADRLVYSGKACIEGNEWGLYFGKLNSQTSGIILIFSLLAILESEDWGKVTFVRDRFRHTCLGHWFYRKFSGDMAMSSTSISQEDNTSGGELLTASEDEEDMAVDSVDQNRNEVNTLFIYADNSLIDHRCLCCDQLCLSHHFFKEHDFFLLNSGCQVGHLPYRIAHILSLSKPLLKLFTNLQLNNPKPKIRYYQLQAMMSVVLFGPSRL